MIERPDESTQPERIISGLRREIDHLRARLEDERLAEQLRNSFTLAATAGTLVSAVSHARLLEMVVETAAHVISAHAGALFLIDEEAEELIFEVAIGPKAQEVKKFRVPLGHGIAGFVAVTGQPIATSNAQQDPRHAADIARDVGYAPQSILCVPLFYGDEVIGVLELLDKEGGGSFDPRDMEVLGFFANQAAVAIEQSRAHGSLTSLIGHALAGARQAGGLEDRARAFASGIEEDRTYRRSIELARLVQEISRRGDAEVQACRSILEGFAGYLRTRPAASSGMEDFD